MLPVQVLHALVNTDGPLTRPQYNIIREPAKYHYPPHYLVRNAKQMCYPTNLKITETIAEVSLQCLLDHATEKIVQAQVEVLSSMKDSLEKVWSITKWGCDGISAQGTYKQKFADTNWSDSFCHLFHLCCLLAKSWREEKTNFMEKPKDFI